MSIQNRETIVSELKRELIGPAPSGEPISFIGAISFSNVEDARKAYVQAESREEILQRDRPTKRYGMAVLYPTQSNDTVGLIPDHNDLGGDNYNPLDAALTDETSIESTESTNIVESDDDDFDLSGANSLRPSSIALSFLAKLVENSQIEVTVEGGVYSKKEVAVGNINYNWWLRKPIHAAHKITFAELENGKPIALDSGSENIKLEISIIARQMREYSDQNGKLITIALVNRTKNPKIWDEGCLFQTSLKIELLQGGSILPYPVRPPLAYRNNNQRDLKNMQEEESIDLLFSKKLVYGIGHGCAPSWVPSPIVTVLEATFLPTAEVPSITPDLVLSDGNKLTVSMSALADDLLGAGESAVLKVLDYYREWIRQQTISISELEPRLQPAAHRHMENAKSTAQRIEDGINLLRANPKAAKAFILANTAMMIQQQRSRIPLRRPVYNYDEERLESIPKLEIPVIEPTWRPFQIAFIYANLCSSINGGDANRETVELIWFPTGGGKTEAYLGLTAFSIFYRRLVNPQDAGVQVLMRYTLRLLTAQQFQRAACLIAAMEKLRTENLSVLGPHSISIGIWVGSATTPNSRKDAVSALRKMQKGEDRNPLLLTKCPWCGTQMGPLSLIGVKGTKSKSKGRPVWGYSEHSGRVTYRCEDVSCFYSKKSLPVFVVDEDVYDERPSLVIATVDKFATLAWSSKARSLFGRGPNGSQMVSPPGLIVQDELHLISGPLGSMVGLYELIIEELCTDRRGITAIKPKIVCSTATIRRYQEQILCLFGRENSSLFPPPGLSDDDSFFGKSARNRDGELEPGRLYVGVHAPGLGSMQTTQSRVMSALLHAAPRLPAAEQDPWWTLLTFFNSLRELGTTLTLIQSDIPDYLKALAFRYSTPLNERRYLNNIRELTSRIQSEEVPAAITELEAEGGIGKGGIDVCLASSIIEVGIDIERLALLAIIGQPKTTSQYIQVSGRVGRNWRRAPGLVVTVYNHGKPRDRSHFEQFQGYHAALYAQVEPTSVTPFSRPALERALHAIMVAYVRQTRDIAHLTIPEFDEKEVQFVKKLVEARVHVVDPSALKYVNAIFHKRTNQWKNWERQTWETKNDEIGLLARAGEARSVAVETIWATPNSMRNVDASCEIQISQLYNLLFI